MIDLHLDNPNHNLEFELLLSIGFTPIRVETLISDFRAAGAKIDLYGIRSMIDSLRSRGYAIHICRSIEGPPVVWVDPTGLKRIEVACRNYLKKLGKTEIGP